MNFFTNKETSAKVINVQHIDPDTISNSVSSTDNRTQIVDVDEILFDTNVFEAILISVEQQASVECNNYQTDDAISNNYRIESDQFCPRSVEHIDLTTVGNPQQQ